VAEGPPLFDTVWPVKVWVTDVPSELVTVRVAGSTWRAMR